MVEKTGKEVSKGELLDMSLEMPVGGWTEANIRLPSIPVYLDSTGTATKRYDTRPPKKASDATEEDWQARARVLPLRHDEKAAADQIAAERRLSEAGNGTWWGGFDGLLCSTRTWSVKRSVKSATQERVSQRPTGKNVIM